MVNGRLWRMLLTGLLFVGMASALHAVVVGAITPGSTVNGSVPSNGTVQSYTFSANAGNTVFLSMLATSGTLVQKMELFYLPSSGPAQSIASAQQSSILQWVFIANKLTQPGNYRIDCSGLKVKILGFNVQTFGNFALSLFVGPNQVTGTASNDADGGPITVDPDGKTGQFDKSGDVDVYTFSAQSGDYITARLERLTGVLAPKIELYDPDGTRIHPSGSTDPEIPPVKLTLAGTYYLVCRSDTGFGTGTYKLTIDTPIEHQPDLGMSTENANYTGLRTYTNVTVSQIKKTGETAVYYIRLYNRSPFTESFLVTGPLGDGVNWNVEYTDLSDNPIPGLMSGAGWTLANVAPGLVTTFKMKVTLTANVLGGGYYNATVTATSLAASGNKTDSVTAHTEKKVFSGVELIPSPGNAVPIGMPLLFTAVPDGGGQVEYLYYQKLGSFWLPIQGNSLKWSTLNTYKWNFTYVPGTYTFRIIAREKGRKVQYESIENVTVTFPLVGVFLTAQPLLLQDFLQPITLTAIPLGGANVSYHFDISIQQSDGTYTPYTSHDNGNDPVWGWDGLPLLTELPAIPGIYSITVTARDENAANPKDYTATIPYIVSVPTAPTAAPSSAGQTTLVSLSSE